MRRESSKRYRQQTTDRQITGKEGKRPRNPIGDMERERERKHVIFFLNFGSPRWKERSKRRKREKIVYFSLPRKRVSRLFHDKRLEVSLIKLLGKSEVCRALFDAEKVFQIFRMDIYVT